MSEPRRPGRRHLSSQLIFWYSVAFLALIALVGVFVRARVGEALVDQLAQSLEANARSVALTLDDGDLARIVETQAEALDARVTIIALDGTVLADSEEEPAAMENHGGRPEVVAAMDGRVGTSRRVSATLNDARLYVAIPPSDGRVVRLSVTESQISGLLSVMQRQVLVVAVMVGLLGMVVVTAVGRRLTQPVVGLTRVAAQVAAGDLDVAVRRSSVAEFDQLGLSIGLMATELGSRFEAANEERERLDDILGSLPIGVFLVDGGDRVVYANSMSHELLGPVPDTLATLVPHSLRKSVVESRSREAVPVEFEVGSPARVIRCLCTSIEGDRVLTVVSDVSERRRIEAMRKDFVADASHELKTPVAAILAASEALQLALDRSPDRAPDFAARIHDSAGRLARIVQDLLDLSRLETSRRVIDEIEIDRVIREETDSLRALAAARHIDLRCDAAPATVLGSRADLAQAVRNLCENALQYTDEGGRVMVRSIVGDGVVVIEVEDDGTGIPTRSLPRVFERFYRVDVARSRATGGTGLGLAIVKHVVENHGGSVSVTSELGAGSTFRIELPAADLGSLWAGDTPGSS